MNSYKKRVDELGRIVIPKQIRNNFKIRNFDELELYTSNDSIILKKSIGIELYKEKLDRFLLFLKTLVDTKIIITDNNRIISSNSDNFIYGSDLNKEKVKETLEEIPLILDSNDIGRIYFIGNKNINNKEFLKNIRDIILDLIN